MRTLVKEPLRYKILRLTTFLFFVQLVVTALLARHVKAEVRDLMLSAGSQMMALGGESMQAPKPRTIRLNGAEIRLRVQTVKNTTMEHVLDVLQARCRARNGQFFDQIQAAKGKAKVKLEEDSWRLLDGVIRDQVADAGIVACLDMGEQKVSPSALVERLTQFARTGDASSIGDLRYARVETSGDDAWVVMLWTDGPLNLRQMFPNAGDAPGLDFKGLPRPPQTRRVLSAWEEGRGPALNMYVSDTLGRAKLEEASLTALRDAGWQQLVPTQPRSSGHASGTMLMKDGLTVVVSAASNDRGRGVISILPMDKVGAASVAIQ